jgi:hypothetical protein
MGKRRFAATISSSQHATTTSKYGNDLNAWIRGWDFGIEVFAKPTVEGDDVFEIWIAGGSNARSNGRKYLGMVTKEGFERAAT